MSIFKVNNDNFENFEISLSPKRYFSSSSTNGITGSIILSLGEVTQSSFFNINIAGTNTGLQKFDSNIDNARLNINSNPPVKNIQNLIEENFDLDNQQLEKQLKLSIQRFSGWLPHNLISSQSVGIKNFCIDILDKEYSQYSDQYGFYYNNFHSLNFQSYSSGLVNDHAIVYPCSGGIYNPNNSPFTFGFSINIREKDLYKTKPGTIIFNSGLYGIYVTTGSSRDENGKVDKYRLILHFGNDTVATLPENLNSSISNCFFSDDNILETNKWHEVFIRWGSSSINNSTGSIIVDNNLSGEFKFDVSPINSTTNSMIFLGSRTLDLSSNNNTKNQYFSDYANNFELDKLSNSNTPLAPSIGIRNFLSAELHDIFISNRFISIEEIKENKNNYSILSGTIFYIKPEFIQDANKLLIRTEALNNSNKSTGIPLSYIKNNLYPIGLNTIDVANVKKISGINPYPYQISISNNFSEYSCMLENFLKEEVKNKFPAIIGLSSSIGSGNNDATNSFSTHKDIIKNDYNKRFYRRNLFILPCDHEYKLKLNTSSSFRKINTDKFGTVDESKIYLDNVITGSTITSENIIDISSGQTNSLLTKFSITENNIIRLNSDKEIDNKFLLSFKSKNNTNDSTLQYIEKMYNFPNEYLQFHQYDNSSPLVTIFKISPLYFGNSIKKGSIVLTDPNFYDSGRKMVLKDNGIGGLYRADVAEPNIHNKVGNVYYDHGIIMIISPALYYFGDKGYELEFNGETNIYTLRLTVDAKSGYLNRSLNSKGDKKDFKLISEINFMDRNFNTVLKTKLAQPILKKVNDRLNFKIKLDF